MVNSSTMDCQTAKFFSSTLDQSHDPIHMRDRHRLRRHNGNEDQLNKMILKKLNGNTEMNIKNEQNNPSKTNRHALFPNDNKWQIMKRRTHADNTDEQR